LYVDTTVPEQPTLAHRCTIWLSPRQTERYIQAAARHEIGHALGIWGHSPDASDALFAAQVGSPGPISARDVNTLKRIYEQPTHIGWPLQAARPD
ncbi:MAG: peptidase, partial [Synechococcales bacterium]|nr:peptidase [Synechococcales bacterium]